MKRPKMSALLPEYPSACHLPWKPNTRGDRIADAEDVAPIFSSDRVVVQEKIDGANCGMALVDGHPGIRSRTKILRKGGLNRYMNPSMAQFAPVFNWFYENKKKFEKLVNQFGNYTVYGEWMVQQHGMYYDNLPDMFVAYDLYDQDRGQYMDPNHAAAALCLSGFATVPMLKFGKVANYEELEALANLPSKFSTDLPGEGIFVKAGDGGWTTCRFKMVRQGFVQGVLLGDEIKKNDLEDK